MYRNDRLDEVEIVVGGAESCNTWLTSRFDCDSTDDIAGLTVDAGQVKLCAVDVVKDPTRPFLMACVVVDEGWQR